MTIATTLSRLFKWTVGTVLALVALVALAALAVALVGWNWLREPIERLTLEKTGRALAIRGDNCIEFAWSRPKQWKS